MKQLGYVSWFNDAKGYGEVVAAGKSFFFTHRNILSKKRHKNLARLSKVKFSVTQKSVFGMPVAGDIEELKQ